VWQEGLVSPAERAALLGGPGATVWLTGLPGAGKSTVARLVERALVTAGRPAFLLDGDNLRHGLNADLGFSAADRAESVRRAGEAALLLAEAGIVVLAALVSPDAAAREAVGARHRAVGVPFLEVHVATPLATCQERDPKGLYRKARAGQLPHFTGIDSPYEAPTDPDVHVETTTATPEDAVEAILAALRERGIIAGG
jgi:bifunctional enzyme CysN/CysC